MNILRKIFGRQRKEKHIKELEQEIQFFNEQTTIQKKYQAALDGEQYCFERVCLEDLPAIIKKERQSHATVPTPTPVHSNS
jgi:hypothetical protein